MSTDSTPAPCSSRISASALERRLVAGNVHHHSWEPMRAGKAGHKEGDTVNAKNRGGPNDESLGNTDGVKRGTSLPQYCTSSPLFAKPRLMNATLLKADQKRPQTKDKRGTYKMRNTAL